MIKQILKKIIPKKYAFYITHVYKSLSFKGFGRTTYAGNGEDILLTEYLFKDKKKGFYVDVGCFHPKLVSNTYLLYKRGWHGINIDPNDRSMILFDLYRRRDINLRMGVAPEEKEMTYYDFAEGGVNTFSEEYAEHINNRSWSTLLSEEKVMCYRLETILDKYVPAGTTIDVLDVDVETFDLEVLKSNNWLKHRPKVVLVEDARFKSELTKNEIYQFLSNQGYEFYSYTDMTLIMKDSYTDT